MNGRTPEKSTSPKALSQLLRQSPLGRLPFFLAVAILFHLILLPLLYHLILKEPNEATQASPLRIDLFNSPVSKSAKERPSDNATVVETSNDNGTSPEPSATRYLSESGSRADKETKQKGLGKPIPKLKVARTPKEDTPKDAREDSTPEITSSSANGASSAASGESGTVAMPQQTEPPKQLKLHPDHSTLATAVAGSGLADLDDLMEGEKTSVNSKAFKHAAFFTRVQKMVEQFWRPDVAISRNDPDAKVIGAKDRVTTVLVVLKQNGEIHSLYTRSPSGAGFLDDEAINAIETAGPFPNVPEGLMNQSDGLVKFLFQFTVVINRKPAIRIRRYQ
ncbi:MAG: TonB C-terminal domain-containing protein [Deltaproteobacteria bacterium]|nr:TonB C-terminal domain-containing protein [Deltaproteobacteria bacterium]